MSREAWSLTIKANEIGKKFSSHSARVKTFVPFTKHREPIEMLSILHTTGVLLILKLRRINQFLVAWVSLSVKFHNYTKGGFRVFIDFVEVQTFISPMSISDNIQQLLLFWF